MYIRRRLFSSYLDEERYFGETKRANKAKKKQYIENIGKEYTGDLKGTTQNAKRVGDGIYEPLSGSELDRAKGRIKESPGQYSYKDDVNKKINSKSSGGKAINDGNLKKEAIEEYRNKRRAIISEDKLNKEILEREKLVGKAVKDVKRAKNLAKAKTVAKIAVPTLAVAGTGAYLYKKHKDRQKEEQNLFSTTEFIDEERYFGETKRINKAKKNQYLKDFGKKSLEKDTIGLDFLDKNLKVDDSFLKYGRRVFKRDTTPNDKYAFMNSNINDKISVRESGGEIHDWGTADKYKKKRKELAEKAVKDAKRTKNLTKAKTVAKIAVPTLAVAGTGAYLYKKHKDKQKEEQNLFSTTEFIDEERYFARADYEGLNEAQKQALAKKRSEYAKTVKENYRKITNPSNGEAVKRNELNKLKTNIWAEKAKMKLNANSENFAKNLKPKKNPLTKAGKIGLGVAGALAATGAGAYLYKKHKDKQK